MTTRATSRLHLGCGRNVVDGWINVDGSMSARLARFPRLCTALRILRLAPGGRSEPPWPTGILAHDLRKPLPFPDAAVHMIYSAHTIEHLYLDEAEQLLRECHRVLVPGGVLRVVVPDLRSLVEAYLEASTTVKHGQLVGAGGGSGFVRDREAHSTRFSALPADRLNAELNFRTRSASRGGVAYRLYTALTDFQTHKWMYDDASLCRHLETAGFAEVSARGLFDSRIPDIELIEQPERVVSGGLCVEGVKREPAYA